MPTRLPTCSSNQHKRHLIACVRSASTCPQDFPAIQRKLVFTLLSPLAWFYLTTAVLQQRSWCRLQLYLGCWFVLGFVTAHKFAC